MTYVSVAPGLIQSRPMQVYTLVKRNSRAFLALDQHIPSREKLTAINVLRAFGDGTSAQRFKSVKDWLSASCGLDFHSDEVLWLYHFRKVRALKASIRHPWILESLCSFEEHLLKKREQLIAYSLKGSRRTPTKAVTILQYMKFATWFMTFCESRGITSAVGIEQSHIDMYLSQHPTHLNSLTSFVRYLNRSKHRISHLDVPVRRGKKNILARVMTVDAKEKFVNELLAFESWSDMRNATAAMICLFYPVEASRVLSLKRNDVASIDGTVHVDFGTGPIPVDPPISTMIERWMANWHWHSRMRDSVESEFLFPGATPGRGYSVDAFRMWLARLGVTKTQMFATAVHGLIAAGLNTPGLLVDLFGISIDTATRYWVDSCGDAESSLNKMTIQAYREKGLLTS